MVDSFWTQEKTDVLREKWGCGLSASQIVRIIGPGISRSGVIGKVHRLGLAGRRPDFKCKGKKQRKPKGDPNGFLFRKPGTFQAPQDGLKEIAPLLDDPPASNLIKLQDIKDSHCKWICQDGGWDEPRYCGRPALSGKPYCHSHCARAYTAADPARRRERREAYLAGFGT